MLLGARGGWRVVRDALLRVLVGCGVGGLLELEMRFVMPRWEFRRLLAVRSTVSCYLCSPQISIFKILSEMKLKPNYHQGARASL